MTEELIKKLKEAKTDEERRAIFEASGEELTDEEAAAIAAGSCGSDGSNGNWCFK